MSNRQASLAARALVAELRMIEGPGRRIVITRTDGSAEDLTMDGTIWKRFERFYDSGVLSRVEAYKGDRLVVARDIAQGGGQVAQPPQMVAAQPGQAPAAVAQAQPPRGDPMAAYWHEPTTLPPGAAPELVQQLQLLDALQHRAFLRMVGAQDVALSRVGAIWNSTMERLGSVVDTQQVILQSVLDSNDRLSAENAQLRADLADLAAAQPVEASDQGGGIPADLASMASEALAIFGAKVQQQQQAAASAAPHTPPNGVAKA